MADAKDEDDSLLVESPEQYVQAELALDDGESDHGKQTPPKKVHKGSHQTKDQPFKPKPQVAAELARSTTAQTMPKHKNLPRLTSYEAEILETDAQVKSLYQQVKQKKREAKAAYKEWLKVVGPLKAYRETDSATDWSICHT